ncbi:glycosyltransferase family 2 protein [Enterococcus sp. 22-H-5-01]|uniref:glycosyltransferase family 2 protein n=1 Tax=Enterococcus sp. 22-H-5-01 TaxID=3418555 RepID=UPI003D009CC0
MNKEYLISVIVPVYNVDNYLEKCINSLLLQTFKNMEIILVNDGSTDKSSFICDDYSNKDSRIKVIHKDNGGLSDARNVGIDYATGKYITFIDSDDYLGENHIYNLYKGITFEENIQISISKLNMVNEYLKNIPSESIQNIELFDVEGALKEMLIQKKFDTNACGKLYDKNLFEGIRFPLGMVYEDLDTIYKLFDLCDKISLTNTNDYFYVYRSNSISNESFNAKKMDIVEITDNLIHFVESNYPSLTEYAYMRAMSACLNVWKQIDGNKNKEQNKILWNKVKYSNSKFSIFNQSRIKTKFAKIFICFGGSMTKKILNTIG